MGDRYNCHIVDVQEKQAVAIEEMSSSPRNRRKSYELESPVIVEERVVNRNEISLVESDAAIVRNGRNTVININGHEKKKKLQKQPTESEPTSPERSPRTSSDSPPSLRQPLLTVKYEIPDKGIVEVHLAKDDKGKLGLKTTNIKNGIYVMEVIVNSPAANASLFPGDQILQINGVRVDEYDDDQMHRMFKKQPIGGNIRMLVNKKPLEKVFFFKKQPNGLIGFNLRGPKIHSVVKHSPADIQGLSNEFYLLEVNGTPIRGMKESQVRQLIETVGDEMKITVMPYYLYEPLFKQIPIR
ncbi:hypothetical protein CHUAL_002251 [Chamberlinius hualienensis]